MATTSRRSRWWATGLLNPLIAGAAAASLAFVVANSVWLRKFGILVVVRRRSLPADHAGPGRDWIPGSSEPAVVDEQVA